MTRDASSNKDTRLDGVGPSIHTRIGCIMAGVMCFSAAFAIAGLSFDFIDLSFRYDWPHWLVFAAFPLFGITVLLVLGLGAILIGYGLSTSDASVSEDKES